MMTIEDGSEPRGASETERREFLGRAARIAIAAPAAAALMTAATASKAQAYFPERGFLNHVRHDIQNRRGGG